MARRSRADNNTTHREDIFFILVGSLRDFNVHNCCILKKVSVYKWINIADESGNIEMCSLTSNNMWELFSLFSTFYVSCFQLEYTLAVLQSSVPVLKLDLRLGPVVIRGYSGNNGQAPVTEGRNLQFIHCQWDFIKKAGNWLRNHHCYKDYRDFWVYWRPLLNKQCVASNLTSGF